MLKIIKFLLIGLLLFNVHFVLAQKKINRKANKQTVLNNIKKQTVKIDLQKINDSVAALIPFKKEGKYGFMNQKGKEIIANEFDNVGFFTEDCTLLASPKESIRKFGTKDYASVRKNDVDYRINSKGKMLYEFKDGDQGKCPFKFMQQLFHAYTKQGFFGVVEDSKFEDDSDYKQFAIYPQYDYMHILEGDDLKNPMIIASRNDWFGVVNTKNEIIIPFIYRDVKRNYSWKLARLFEVSLDGKNFFYVDDKNHEYIKK